MAWTNALILGLGGALISVPIILHFLMQPKPKRVMFPAFRFLKERQQRNRSRTRLRHILLLLLRCLLIGLLALALAGPSVGSREFGNWVLLGGIGFSALVVGIVLLASLMRQPKNWLLIGILGALLLGHLIYGGWSASRLMNSETAEILGDSQAPVAALIVIDTSPRMQYRMENQTRLEVAQEMGKWLIGQFPADSQVCVVATDFDRPFFSIDVAAAARRIETLETTYVSNSIPASLADGLLTLEKAEQERQEVYVITDLTRQSWTGDDTKPVLRQLEKNAGMSLFVIDVGVEEPSNFSLTSLELATAEIAENGSLSLTTQVNRNGGSAQRSVKMIIEKPDGTRPVVRDGKSLFPAEVLTEQSKTIDIRENASVQLPFQFSQPLPSGTYHGRIEIEGEDGLQIDDERYFTFRVRPAWDILVVHPTDVSPKNLVSTIAPSLNRELGKSIYECEVIQQTQLDGVGDFEKYDAVFLLDPTPINQPQWEQLEKYVQNGGGLAICLGHNASKGPFVDPSFQTETARKILTGTVDRKWLNEEADLFLSPQDISHPLFKMFRKNETGMAWNLFPVFQFWGIESEATDEFPTQTLLTYSNREPAVIERQIGNGRVLVMTTPITERSHEPSRRTWNDLFVGKFLPAWMLVRSITSYLVQNDTESLNTGIGQVASFENDLRAYPETYQVFSPRPEKPPANLNTIDGEVRFRFIDTPGHYRMKGVLDQSPILRGFSANLPDAATDLSRIEMDELDGVLGPERYQLAKQKDDIQRKQGTTRRGQEFYPMLMLMMLVVFAVEYLMSNRFYRG